MRTGAELVGVQVTVARPLATFRENDPGARPDKATVKLPASVTLTENVDNMLRVAGNSTLPEKAGGKLPVQNQEEERERK